MDAEIICTSRFLSPRVLKVMKNKLMAYAVIALAAVLISGCASSTDENPTLEAAKQDRTKSSMYAR
jgi:hypothetical protein